MPLVWKKDYELGIEIIDRQHRKYIETLNGFYLVINQGLQAERLRALFGELEDYINLHLQTEEKYFAEFNYDGTAEHLAQHEEFRNQLAKFKKEIESQKWEVVAETVDYLENWLLNHILVIDKKYVPCFLAHGLK